MLLIPCVHCGPRAEIEFSFGGEAGSTRPADPFSLTDEAWGEYLYMRDNPKGRTLESWVHSGGCGQWFTLVRDTVTHKIEGAFPPGSAPEQADAAGR